jgi:hypothetical protein
MKGYKSRPNWEQVVSGQTPVVVPTIPSIANMRGKRKKKN